MGWRPPEDRTHEQRYALARSMPAVACPVVMGVPWYEAFDQPVLKGGAYWIGLGDLGRVRGGHAVCLRPPAVKDVASAHAYCNQGVEGSCVGWAVSRAATLLNRRLYNGFPLYEAAKRRDPWAGEDYDGTSVNAGLDTLRLEGAWPVRAGVTSGPRVQAGVSAFRWAHTVYEVTEALHSGEPFVRLLNSWGVNYPKEVRVPLAVIERLLAEGGEFGVPVDRSGA